MEYLRKIILFTIILMTPQIALAAEGVSAEVSYILNTFLFLVMGVLVMFMAAGFTMLESGMVRSCSVVSILLKNISLYSVAGIMFMLVGYNLMYADVSGFMGSLGVWMASDPGVAKGDFSSNYSSSSDWFFQMVFVATTASIVSGTLAERIRVVPFLVFVAVLTGLIYPITGAWKWGGGWLDAMGFQDFAGSSMVHSVGGWAALAGAHFLGARVGRFEGGYTNGMPASSLPMVALGTLVLWMGWFGFNGGSQLALGSGADATAISTIFVNTNMAAAGGTISALILTHFVFGKIDLTFVLNGALGGLVSITAEPLNPNVLEATLIGAVGGAIVVFVTPLLDKRRIDDVVGAIPVHLCCGIWGTLIVPFTNSDANFVTQLIGVGAIGFFVLTVSIVVWGTLKATVGIRLSDESQMRGADMVEFGTRAYSEFCPIELKQQLKDAKIIE